MISATSAAVTDVELHEIAMPDGKMVMRPKKGGFVIPARGTHELEPGGDHIMLMGLAAAVKPGDEVAFTLKLADGDGGDRSPRSARSSPAPRRTTSPAWHERQAE